MAELQRIDPELANNIKLEAIKRTGDANISLSNAIEFIFEQYKGLIKATFPDLEIDQTPARNGKGNKVTKPIKS